MSKSAPVTTLLQNRGALLQVLVAAVLLALGVNLLSTAITDALGNKFALYALTLSLLALSLAIVVRQTIPSRRVHRKITGFVVFRSESSELVKVPRYNFSEQLNSFVEGLFAENTAPKRLWDSDPIHKGFEFDAQAGEFSRRQTEAGQLIVEATEYYVLEELSTHLTDYFNQSGLASEQLQRFSREDVPDILFRNRFLDTFSRPMRDRAAFSSDLAESSMFGNIISSYGPDGILYSKFDLTLPSGTRVQRLSPSSILIETPKFKLSMSVEFAGVGEVLPNDFSELYLDGLSFTEVRAYKVGLDTSVEFRPLALLSRSGWGYHAWLDSFLDKLATGMDSEEFLRNIQWEAAATVAQVMRRTLRARETEHLTVPAVTPDQ